MRYLVLIYDQKVIDILYNPGSQADPEPIHYREYRVDTDTFYELRFEKSSPVFHFGKITKIPY